jgi:FAD/FMN-containing dehydrogenase
MLRPASPALLDSLQALLGPRGFSRDPESMAPWLTDWRGRYLGRAAALLSPASTIEVQGIVARCAEARVALVAEGDSLLLSLRRMNSVRSVSAEDNVAVAEAGVILSDLHEAAAAAGRRFPLSLGAKGSATVGGLVSTNAGGTQVLRFGPMRSLVAGIEAVLPDGSLIEGLSALRKDNRGYDLKQLLIGAEGTLGVVTAASLKLFAAPGSHSVAWVGLESPAAALALLRRLEARLGEAVESFELVPEDVLGLVLGAIPGTRAPLAGRHRWHVLIEAVAPQGARDAGEVLQEALAASLEEGLAQDALVAASEAQASALWRLRESVAEAERLQAPSVKHDVSVPVAAMPAFIERARAAVEAGFEGARVVAFGHLGDGNVHFNVQPPAAAQAEAWLAEKGGAVTRLVHDLAGEAGGSISAEHGIGQAKLAELARTASPARLAALRAIKQALDPAGIMNPGKLLPSP